eukprot:Sspe_Gene.76971::Locus_48072_Transcript_1_1_Confidence_1.000_Length_714::g.76971::m.76971
MLRVAGSRVTGWPTALSRPFRKCSTPPIRPSTVSKVEQLHQSASSTIPLEYAYRRRRNAVLTGGSAEDKQAFALIARAWEKMPPEVKKRMVPATEEGMHAALLDAIRESGLLQKVLAEEERRRVAKETEEVDEKFAVTILAVIGVSLILTAISVYSANSSTATRHTAVPERIDPANSSYDAPPPPVNKC